MESELQLSRRVQELMPSATMAMNAKAKKLAAEGKDVISFSVGEPDFTTPQHICDAAIKAILGGRHGYTAVGGTPRLKKAIAAAMTRDTGVHYTPEQVVASPGGKYSLYLTLLALINPGDEVIIPAPYWVSYPEMVRLVGGVPVQVDTREDDLFAVTAEQIERAVTPRTKMLILTSPSNPTGQIVPSDALAEIGRLLERHGMWCMSDEIYSHLIFGDAVHKSIAAVSDYCRERTVVVNGCSKTYAMTGWRLGWIAAPRAVATAVEDLQGQTCSNPCSIAQAAATAALDGPQESVELMRAEFNKRSVIITDLLDEIRDIKCSLPRGAFYVLPNISGLFGRTIGGRVVNTPTDFCEVALERVHVAMVPGEAFAAPNHVRLSYATGEEKIREGCRRIKELVES